MIVSPRGMGSLTKRVGESVFKAISRDGNGRRCRGPPERADTQLFRRIATHLPVHANSTNEKHQFRMNRNVREVAVSDRDCQLDGQPTPGSPNTSASTAPPDVRRDMFQLSRLTAESRHDPDVNGQRIALIESLLRRMKPDQSPALRGMFLNDLGQAYTDWSGGNRATNLSRAIACLREALRFRALSVSPRRYAMTQSNLGLAYTGLPIGDRADNVRQAITCFGEALTVYTPEVDPTRYAMLQSNLGMAYVELPTGDRAANLQRAASCFYEALRFLSPETSPYQHAMIQANLGNAYRVMPGLERYESLEKAISCYQQALYFLTPTDFPSDYAMVQNNLGNAYAKSPTGDQQNNLRKAIQCYRAALGVYTWETAPFEYAGTQNNLGCVFRNLSGDRSTNLRDAIACYREALRFHTPTTAPLEYAGIQYNLGTAYLDLAACEPEEHLQLAIKCYRRALIFCTPETAPEDHRMTSWALGDLFFGEARWEEAHTAYASAIAVGESLYQASATDVSRQGALAEAGEIIRSDAYCLARLGLLTEAIERLESGRARALSGTLARDQAALELATPQDRKEFATIRERIGVLGSQVRSIPVVDHDDVLARSFAEIAADLAVHREALSSAADRIRAYVPEFMPTGLDLGAISTAPDPDCPLVYLATTPQGTLALIVPRGLRMLTEEQVIWLDAFTEKTLNRILYDRDGETGLLTNALGDSKEALVKMLDEALPLLGEKIGLPIADRLLALGYHRCSVVPCGRLGLLPLHAIKLPNRGYLDEALEFSYIPSARTLLFVRQRTCTSAVPRFFGVADPPHSEQVNLGELRLSLPKYRLHYARAEVEGIAALFPKGTTDILWADEATRTAILAHAAVATYLHFVCHGTFNVFQPLTSGLDLAGDDRLTLADILSHLDLSGARLAVLSACQTALTEPQRIPDESIGLPAGFLQAGVSGVIATLWSVADVSSALLLMRFYHHHLKDGLNPAEALRRAQQWLRESTVDELDLVAHLGRRYQESGEADRDAFNRMAYYRGHRQEKPFAHPYYWAAFAYYGAAQ